jgi:hypothetical protein
MRPGGLTALAIFNFVFGGLGVLGGVLNLALGEVNLENMEKAARLFGDSPPSAGMYYTVQTVDTVRAGLLVMAGIGYLGLRKTLGRTVGNAYAVIALVGIFLEASMLPHMFSIMSLSSFVYPLITLFLLNVIFRKDFVR